MLWGSQTKARLANSNQKKSGILVRSMGVLSKECTGEGPGRQGRPSQGLLRTSRQELTFTCDSEGCSLGRSLAWGSSVSLRPHAGYLDT